MLIIQIVASLFNAIAHNEKQISSKNKIKREVYKQKKEFY